jgi:hypothetical protein
MPSSPSKPQAAAPSATSSKPSRSREAKTRPADEAGDAAVAAYLATIDDPARRADCDRLVELMRAATGCPPVMWGSSIVGFGRYHYRYDSGHEGDSCRVGFSSRKGDLSIYLLADGGERAALLAALGRHKMGKACLYVKRLTDVDESVLMQLIRRSLDETARRYGA